MKRFLSLVLSLAMILPIMLAATPALAEENPYAEHLTFKVFTIDGSDDMFNWPLVKQAMESLLMQDSYRMPLLKAIQQGHSVRVLHQQENSLSQDYQEFLSRKNSCLL